MWGSSITNTIFKCQFLKYYKCQVSKCNFDFWHSFSNTISFVSTFNEEYLDQCNKCDGDEN